MTETELNDIISMIKICPHFDQEIKANISRDDSHDSVIKTIEPAMLIYHILKSNMFDFKMTPNDALKKVKELFPQYKYLFRETYP